ncbi:MAG: hypothetical protein HC919_09650 [Oscillatoriales cyanobacterium SM2_2_1]|nr:hypothetical protein [Oscillatoriales cyanobacterium SM2_2_1]
MASATQVKEYLCQWLQLGHHLCFDATNSADLQCLSCRHVVHGERYSQEFESLWQRILAAPQRAHLQGGAETFADLLRPEVELSLCPRCDLLTPCQSLGVRHATACPCEEHHLPFDPNGVMPRSPIQTRTYLSRICDQLASAQIQP